MDDFPQKHMRPFDKGVGDKVATLLGLQPLPMADKGLAYDLITRLCPNEMTRIHHLGNMQYVARTIAAFDLLEAAVKP